VSPQAVSFSNDDEPEELLAGRTTASLFQVLGVKAAVGRVFTAEEDVFGRNDVVLLTHKLWAERFGSDPKMVGRTITIDGRPSVITGVLPKEFSLGSLSIDLWVPLALSPERALPRDLRTATLIGKLKPGVSLEQAQAELDVIARRFQSEYPESYPGTSGYRLLAVPAHEDLVGDLRAPLLVLLGATGLVLVIACLNVANLLLVRATTRTKEVAIRTALGSSRATLVRQFLIEGLLLALLGSALGLLLAFWATRLLVTSNPVNIPRLDQVRLDGGVLLFALGLVVVTGAVFGLAPALQSTRRNSLRAPLQDGGKTSAGTTGGQRPRNALVVVEIAVALVVLVGAGLMIQSFRRLLEVDPGFRTRDLLTARFILKGQQYMGPRGLEFQRQLLEETAALPHIEGAALASELPMGIGMNLLGDIVVEGKVLGPDEPAPITGWRMVSPGYFKVMDIAILKGRPFGPADHEAAPGAVIVDEDLASRLWPGENPLGKRLKLNSPYPQRFEWRTVVGVADHVRQHGLAEAGGDQLYIPLAQSVVRMLTLVVRPAAGAGDLAAPVRETIRSMDPGLPVDLRTIEETIGGSLTHRRFNTLLFLAFGLIALTLTVIGIYGVMAYSVAQRTRDMGIRMALGAQKQDVLRLIVGQGARLALAGLLLGLVAAWGLSRLMSSLLYDVGATDLVTFLGVSLVLGVLALAASYLPARRAAKVEPVVALRYE
ncbi:MAG TPA: ABC transporter permease, partial [Thermoanaerobaculia bacterium]|nr:ABC transporter permease [Thermoanaerobaculia bacterium]